MGDWALGAGLRSQDMNTAGNTASGGVSTVVTGGATANTKGSWSQLIASTSFDAMGLLLYVSTQYQDTRYLIDVGIGASGSETVVVSNLLFGVPTGICLPIYIPIAVPSGSRIAARCQDNFGSSGAYLSANIIAGGWIDPPSFSSVTDYGTSTSTSGGTTVDAGGTANTKGSYTQIVASTTYTHKGMMIASTRPTPATAMAADYTQIADVAIGASGSEQIIIPNLRMVASIQSGGATGSPLAFTGRGMLNPAYTPFMLCDIPAGSRIAIRQQSTSTNATDRTCAYAVYGLN